MTYSRQTQRPRVACADQSTVAGNAPRKALQTTISSALRKSQASVSVRPHSMPGRPAAPRASRRAARRSKRRRVPAAVQLDEHDCCARLRSIRRAHCRTACRMRPALPPRARRHRNVRAPWSCGAGTSRPAVGRLRAPAIRVTGSGQRRQRRALHVASAAWLQCQPQAMRASGGSAGTCRAQCARQDVASSSNAKPKYAADAASRCRCRSSGGTRSRGRMHGFEQFEIVRQPGQEARL